MCDSEPFKRPETCEHESCDMVCIFFVGWLKTIGCISVKTVEKETLWEVIPCLFQGYGDGQLGGDHGILCSGQGLSW